MEYINVTNRSGGDVTLDRDIEEMRTMIKAGTPMIVRGLLTAEETQQIRDHCVAWKGREEQSNPEITSDSKNYHRININPELSTVKSIMQSYRFFYWNKETDALADLFRRAMRLRNQLSGLRLDYAEMEIEDGYVSMPFVSHYLRGGGWMQKHSDPVTSQSAVVVVNLSVLGKDFSEGGLYFTPPSGEQVPVDPLVQPGDAFVFFPSIPHGIEPIDPDATLDWGSADGRWMFTSSLVNAKGLNGEQYAGMEKALG